MRLLWRKNLGAWWFLGTIRAGSIDVATITPRLKPGEYGLSDGWARVSETFEVSDERK